MRSALLLPVPGSRVALLYFAHSSLFPQMLAVSVLVYQARNVEDLSVDRFLGLVFSAF